MIIKGPYGNITVLPVVMSERDREHLEEELYRTLARISYDIAVNQLNKEGKHRAEREIACTKAKT